MNCNKFNFTKWAILCLLMFGFTLQNFAQKSPFPKLLKLAETGKYDECISESKLKLTKAEGADKQYLYGLIGYAQLKTSEKGGVKAQDLLKKSMTNAINMKKAVAKSAGVDYTVTPFFEQYLLDLKLAVNSLFTSGNLESTDFSKIIEQSELLWGKSAAIILKVNYFEATEQNAALVNTLQDAVVANYQARKSGDTTNILYLFEKLNKALISEDKIGLSLEILERASMVYPNKKEIFFKAFRNYYSKVEDAALIREKIFNDWVRLDSFYSKNYPEKKDSLLEKIYLVLHKKQLDYLLTYPDYFNSVNLLNSKFPKTYNLNYFEQAFLSQKTDISNKKDSWMFAALIDLQKFKTTALKLNYSSGFVQKLLDKGEVLYANNLYLFLNRNFKASPAELKKIKSQIDKVTLNQLDQNLFNNNFLTASKYIIDNPTDKATYKKVLDYTVAKLNALVLKKDFSQCMRITKLMQPVFQSEITFNNAVFQWKKLDYEFNCLAFKSSRSFGGVGTNETTCKPGIIADSNNIKFMRVLNYYRRQVGVFDSCILNKQYNKYAQSAALIMSANSLLSHAPEKSLKCYTEDGYNGASHSNLSLGADGIFGMDIQMEDGGGNNKDVGHRRWILYPRNTVFGLGSTNGAMALYVLGNENIPNYDYRNPFDSNKDYVTWPAAGFFPAALVPNRWSFSMAGADFTNSTITATHNGKTVNCGIESKNGPYGLSTIVWVLEDFIKLDASKPVKIKISNFKIYSYSLGKETTSTIEYMVSLF